MIPTILCALLLGATALAVPPDWHGSADLADGLTTYQPTKVRPWSFWADVTPFVPTGHFDPTPQDRNYTLTVNGLDPDETYEVMLYFGLDVEAVGVVYGWYYDLGNTTTDADGRLVIPDVDVGHHAPVHREGIIFVYLEVWQPSPRGYWSVTYGWAPDWGGA